MSNLQITPVRYAIHKKGESPIYGDDAVHLTVQDTGAGYFYTIESISPSDTNDDVYGQGKLSLDTEEIMLIAKLVEKIEDGDIEIPAGNKK